MKISTITYTPKPIQYSEPDGDDFYTITEDIKCIIHTERRGELLYSLLSGFRTNFRSGPEIVDLIAPKTGESDVAISWAIHDANYSGLISRKFADILLYRMLSETTLEPWQCEAVYIGVFLLGSIFYQKDGSQDNIEFDWPNNPRDLPIVSSEIMFDMSIELEEDIIFKTDNKQVVLETLLDLATQTGEILTEEEIIQFY